jgi:hypothetical protein
MDLFRYCWIHLLPAIVKEEVSAVNYGCIQIWLDSLTSCNSKGEQCQCQSCTGVSKYGWIHILPAIVMEDSVSRQSSMDLFRYSWIHLLPAVIKEDNVSRQSSMDIFRYC